MARAAIDAATGVTEKQEAFALEFVKNGGNATAAYISCYDCNNAKGATINRAAKELLDNPKIGARIAHYRAVVQNRAIEEAVADKAWVMTRLKVIAERCLQSAPVMDRKGLPVLIVAPDGKSLAPLYGFDPKAATGALHLLGIEAGAFVKRAEVGKPGEFDHLSDAELEAEARSAVEEAVKGGFVKVLRPEKQKASRKSA